MSNETTAVRFRLEALTADHAINVFVCEDDDCNDFLHKDALRDMVTSLSRTFVLIDNEEPATNNVAGFFSLVADAVTIDEAYFGEVVQSEEEEDLIGPTKKQTIRSPLAELIFIARDLKWKKQGIGNILMLLAIYMVSRAASCVGLIGLHLRSNGPSAKFYNGYDFIQFKEHPLYDGLRYILPIRDVHTFAGRIPAELLSAIDLPN